MFWISHFSSPTVCIPTFLTHIQARFVPLFHIVENLALFKFLDFGKYRVNFILV